MANKYGIPDKVENKIRKRDMPFCVYCRKRMTIPKRGGSRSNWATIEHLDERGPGYWDESWNGIRLSENNLAICCFGCNASRGQHNLYEWFRSSYCVDRKIEINKNTVTAPVKKFIRAYYK